VLAIGQASHAWISGQFARAWGNAEFGALDPSEEVTLAAEQHDIGMAAWDLHPDCNPGTGLPYSFMEMPLEVHLELWSEGPRRLIAQSRYAALLVSMHGTRLYERRDLEAMPVAQADAVRAFLTDQRDLQHRLLASLRSDPATAPCAADDVVARNSQLIWTWDSLSLAVCLDWAPFAVRAVPTARGSADVRLEPSATGRHLSLAPWPFASESLAVRCEGRRLEGPCDSDDALVGVLESAPWETLEFELAPGRAYS
jgi:Protein of unknown function (DUF3891)